MKRREIKRIRNIHLLPGSDENEVRQRTAYVRRRRSPAKRLLIRLLVVIGVLLVLFMLWNNWETVAPESVLDWAHVQLGNGEAGKGYPYTIAGSTVVGMGQTGNYLAVLSDSSLQFLNAAAGCVEQRPNTLSDPIMQTVGQYALITELGGSRFRLENRRETVLEMNLQNRKIYASDVLSSGTVAVVTDSTSQSYISHIQVYSKTGKLLYDYQSGKYLLTNISLAPGGKALAAVGTTAEGGALKSVLLLFDLSSKTPVEHAGTDQLLYDVTHFGDKVLAIGDAEYWVADSHTISRNAHEGMEVVGYAASRKAAGLVMRRSGSAGSGEVWLFNTKGERVKTYPFSGNFRMAACHDLSFLWLADSTVFVISENESDTQINVPTDTLSAAPYRDTVILLTLSDLEQIKQ